MNDRLIHTIVVHLFWAMSTQAEPVAEVVQFGYKDAIFEKIEAIPRSNGVFPQIIGNLVKNFPSCLSLA